MKIADLREQRELKVAEMRGLVENAEREKRDLSDNERQRFDALKGEERMLADKLQRAEYLAEIERRADATPIDGSGGDFERECSRVSVARAVLVAMGKADGGREREVSAEIARRNGKAPQGIFVPTSLVLGETRAQIVGASPQGGYLVGTDHRPDLMIDRLRPALVVEALGATVLQNLSGDIDIPKLTASATAQWVGEHSAPTRSSQTFGAISMAPRTVAAEVEYSRRMILQSAPAIEGLLRGDLRLQLAGALDAAAIAGDGVIAPLGLLNEGDLPTVAAGDPDGAPFNSDIAAKLIAAPSHQDVTEAGAFLTTTKVKAYAMAMKDGEGRYLTLPGIFQGERAVFSTRVPSDLTKGSGTNLSALIYGAWSNLMLAYWSGVDLLPNPYHSDVASKGGVLLHAFLDADVAVRHIEAFAACADIGTGDF